MWKYSHDRIKDGKCEEQDRFDKYQGHIERKDPPSVIFTLEHFVIQNTLLRAFPFPDAEDNQHKDTNYDG